MNCNGQCYLAKQLKASEEKEQKSNSERLEKTAQLELAFQVFTTEFRFSDSFFQEPVQHNFTSRFFYPNTSKFGFFHPPQA
jgi:hypothetical protein